MRNLAVILLVLALLGGATAAFAITEALKLERSPVTAPRFDKRFSPVCACETATARLQLRFRKPDRVDAVIVDRAGTSLRTLLTNEPIDRGDATFSWDGRDDASRVVADGRYRLQIHLDRQRRTILLPNAVEVDTKPPPLRLVDVPRVVFSPNGDGRNDRLGIIYRTGEKASVSVLVEGVVAVRSRMRQGGTGALSWGGEIAGAASSAGVYEVAIQARDRAGNLSELSEAVTVRILFLDLTREVYSVRRGGLLRFRVATDALPFRWSLHRFVRSRLVGEDLPPELRSGESDTNAVAVRLPRALRAGRYILRVEAAGHEDRATVLVTRAPRR